MAGARQSRNSRKGKLESAAFGLRRPTPSKAPLPRVIVACDDTHTAVRYFTELKQHLKATINIVVIPAPRHGATATQTVRAAHAEWAATSRLAKVDTRDSCWALVDTESDPASQSRASEAVRVGTLLGVSVLRSCPCFEVWTLLHLVDTGEQFADCAKVLSELGGAWERALDQPMGTKSQADYRRLLPFRTDAARRAQRRSAARDADGCWTDVYRLSVAIDGLVQPPDLQ